MTTNCYTNNIPKFKTPNKLSSIEYFDKLCLKGLKEKYGKNISDTIINRYNDEKAIISELNFIDIFLHHQKIIKSAKEKNIDLGIYRGSCNASLICYLLGLTHVDPIKYCLPFSRFISRERCCYPVLSIDIRPEQKNDFIKVVSDKYKEENIAIDTQPNDPLIIEDKFLDETDIFISNKPIEVRSIISSDNYYLKFNLHSFVGLDGVIGYDNFYKIPVDNNDVYSLINQGKFSDIFLPYELNEPGARELFNEINPQNIEEISGFYALFREIAIKSGLVQKYLEAKKSKNREYYCEELKPILETTYGIIIYQEQIIQVLNILGGFSSEKADIIRRLMATCKNVDEYKKDFIDNATNKIDNKKANKLWNTMCNTARACFLKAHSISFAQILYYETYQKLKGELSDD